MARLLKLVASVVGALAYIWYAAVRSAPLARRRKAARRRARLARRARAGSADPR